MKQINLDRLLKIETARMPATVSYPADDMRINGTPRRASTPVIDFQAGSAGVGFWEAEFGAWKFAYPLDRSEVFHVLKGTFSLEGENAPRQEFTAGDTGVIPAGFVGTLSVLEAVRKMYVLLPRAAR
ncbi:cupin [Pandoraea communis]|uniref:Cupin n=1 Tax=Pandoraea communis TaxID=2508297 RepID=A0A5E4SUJ8_9BURK|nr:cupin domain-containing protein [Pandoraea communis]VVD79215.1 cupin [Pandoraea communis]